MVFANRSNRSTVHHIHAELRGGLRYVKGMPPFIRTEHKAPVLYYKFVMTNQEAKLKSFDGLGCYDLTKGALMVGRFQGARSSSPHYSSPLSYHLETQKHDIHVGKGCSDDLLRVPRRTEPPCVELAKSSVRRFNRTRISNAYSFRKPSLQSQETQKDRALGVCYTSSCFATAIETLKPFDALSIWRDFYAIKSFEHAYDAYVATTALPILLNYLFGSPRCLSTARYIPESLSVLYDLFYEHNLPYSQPEKAQSASPHADLRILSTTPKLFKSISKLEPPPRLLIVKVRSSTQSSYGRREARRILNELLHTRREANPPHLWLGSVPLFDQSVPVQPSQINFSNARCHSSGLSQGFGDGTRCIPPSVPFHVINRNLAVNLLNTVSSSLEMVPTTKAREGEAGDQGLKRLRQTKIFNPWEIGDRVEITQGNTGASATQAQRRLVGKDPPRTSLYFQISQVIHQHLGVNIPRSACRLIPPRLNAPRPHVISESHSVPSCSSPRTFTASRSNQSQRTLGLQREQGWEYDSFQAGDNFEYSGSGPYSPNLGTPNESIYSSEQFSSPQLLQEHRVSGSQGRVLHVPIEQALNSPTPQTRYPSGSNSVVQQPGSAPDSPVPLTGAIDPYHSTPTEDSRFVAGWQACVNWMISYPAHVNQSRPDHLDLPARMPPPSNIYSASDRLPSTQSDQRFTTAGTSHLLSAASYLPASQVGRAQYYNSPGLSTAPRYTDHSVATGLQLNDVPIFQESVFALENGASSNIKTKQTCRPAREKRYRCEFEGCDKAFSKRYQLQDHLHKHNGEPPPYPCDFPECSQRFTNRANMRRHYRKKHLPPTQ